MYAVILTGGKQYKVKPGDVLDIEKLEIGVGETVTFDKVLMIIDGEKVELGAPYISGKAVKGEVVAQGRGKKIRIIKFRRRKHSMTTQGHRQYLTTIRITDVAGKKAEAPKTAAKPAAEKKAAEAKPATEKKPAAKPAEKKPAAKAAPKKAAEKKPAAKKDDKPAAAKKPAAKKPAAKKTDSDK